MLRRIMLVVMRIMLAMALAVIIMFLPPPAGTAAWLTNVQVPVTVFLLVCYIGKLLYDTLFYDHFVP